MSKTVSDFVFERLHEWGIDRIYGFPGDGANGLFTAMDRAMDKFDLVRVSHEEMSAFMACAHSKFTGDVGVCMATSGPGAIHLLNGLYDAKMDHQSVVAIVGQQARMALGGTYQQEVDLTSLFKDVAGDYVQLCSDPAQITHLIDRAIRISLGQRCVTCVIIPNDVQELDFAEPPRVHGCVASGVGYLAPCVVPFAGQLENVLQKLGLEYEIIDDSCCGMAGAFGFTSDHYDISVKIGEQKLCPAVREADDETLIIANGFSCQQQIEQLTGRKAMHLAQVVEMAMEGERILGSRSGCK